MNPSFQIFLGPAGIYNYLIEYPTVFSKESLKAYKSLEGYIFFISGHVQEVYYQDSSPTNHKFCFIKSEVLLSQRQGSKQVTQSLVLYS